MASLNPSDQDAVATAYCEHGSAVFGIARRVMGDVRMAEEVTEEVFLFLWRTPDSFNLSKGPLRTLLCTHAHRRAVDRVRNEQLRRRDRRVADGEVQTVIPRSPETANVLVQHDLQDRARRAVASLSQNEREVIELAYYQGHTYREVAAILGLPEGTTNARIRSAMNSLSVVLSSPGTVTA